MFTHFAGEVCVNQICVDLAQILNLWVIMIHYIQHIAQNLCISGLLELTPVHTHWNRRAWCESL